MFTIVVRLFALIMLILIIIILLEELHISEVILSLVRILNNKLNQFHRKFNHEEWMLSLIERKSFCSKKTVLTFKKVGRLGNQESCRSV